MVAVRVLSSYRTGGGEKMNAVIPKFRSNLVFLIKTEKKSVKNESTNLLDNKTGMQFKQCNKLARIKTGDINAKAHSTSVAALTQKTVRHVTYSLQSASRSCIFTLHFFTNAI